MQPQISPRATRPNQQRGGAVHLFWYCYHEDYCEGLFVLSG